MSEDKDIVTEPLPPKKEKIKDPKKVAAGLALAKRNKEAREALAREKAREASAREASEPESTDSSEQDTLSSLSWQHFIGLGGLAIGVAGLYLQWRKTTQNPVVTNMPSRVEPQIEKHSTPPMV